MKHLWPLISLFLAFNSFGSSNFPVDKLCKEIEKKVDTLDGDVICEDIVKRYPENLGIVRSICVDVTYSMQLDTSEKGIEYCRQEMNKLADLLEGGRDPYMSGFSYQAEPEPMIRVNSAKNSTAIEQCRERPPHEMSCVTDNNALVLPKDINTIMDRVLAVNAMIKSTPATYSEAECACLEKSLKENFENINKESLPKAYAKEEKRINDLAYNALGKKLINSFARNLEDVTFYRTNNINSLGGEQSARYLQCNDFESFQREIKNTCAQTNVPENLSNKRLLNLLGAFGDFKKEKNPKNSFTKLQNDILHYQLDPSKVLAGESKTFSRIEYDRVRYGVYKARPEVRFINDVTNLAVKDPIIGKEIEKNIESGKSPGHAIFAILKEESRPEVKALLEKMVAKHLNDPFYKNIKVILQTETKEDLNNFMMNVYSMATDIHPGLKNIFKDKKLFNKVKSAQDRLGQQTLLDTLESNPHLLIDHFTASCEKLKKEFAEAVCIPDDNIVARADRNDLNKLLSSVESQLNPALKDLLICKMPEKNPSSIFTKLSFNIGDKLNQADYFQMKVEPQGKPRTTFGRMAYDVRGGSSETKKYYDSLVSIGDETRIPSVEYEGIAPRKQEYRESTENYAISFQAPSPEYTDFATTRQEIGNQYQNAIAQDVAPRKVQHQTEEEDPKSLLKKFLSDKHNQDEVEKHLSRTSPEDHKELLRLKDELQNNKLRLQELLSETERMKGQKLEREIKALEKEIADSASVPSQNSAFDETNFHGQGVSRPIINQEIARDVAAVTPTHSFATGGASTGGGQSPQQQTTPQVAQTAVKGEIIIHSESIKATAGLEKEAISEEVISFLRKENVDLQTLQTIKDSGMTLKFKVLQNGQEIEKVLKVTISALTDEAKRLLDQKYATLKRNADLAQKKREYSFTTLKQLLGMSSDQLVH